MLAAMRHTPCPSVLACCLAVVAACGGKNNGGDDDGGIEDLGPQPPCTTVSGSTVKVRKLPGKLGGGAMVVTSPPGDPRLFVVDQRGAIRIFEDEVLAAAPFLDLSQASGGPVIAGGEQGLLGLAFHPQYAQNGQFFVWYTAANPAPAGDPWVDVLARFTVSAADRNKANPAGTVVLSIPDFATNHNGGMLEFGPDGYLYAGTGDGGGGGDPNGNGQKLDALLGKMLRIDVDLKLASMEYGIPADNPFSGGGGAPEVFMIGVRNPWRWSFDSMTGDLWIGDVGQGAWEELDVIKAGAQNGGPGTPLNLGWDTWEANACYPSGSSCGSRAGKVFPLDARPHSDNWLAIIAGQVYRGSCYPEIAGWHFYTDNARGGLTKARLKTDNTLEIVELPGTFPQGPASIHADSRGELYETDVSGNVYHIEAAP